jgi:hypothetical protein
LPSRSSSHSYHPRRQPSPPQAEAGPHHASIRNSKRKSFPLNSRPKLPASTNAFDPFLDSDSDRPTAPAIKPVRPTPTLASHPSGILAKRRGHVQASPTPAPAKAVVLSGPSPSWAKPVAVPFPISKAHSPSRNISRSDPVQSHMRQRSMFSGAFPICDDTTEYGDDDTPPHTPVTNGNRNRTAFAFDDGPRTAPLSKIPSRFPFRTPSPTPTRRHRRTPSEGVFHMSSDEDSSYDMTEMLTLFNKGKAPFFASSSFQNSPSPDELPPPSFGAPRL